MKQSFLGGKKGENLGESCHDCYRRFTAIDRKRLCSACGFTFCVKCTKSVSKSKWAMNLTNLKSNIKCQLCEIKSTLPPLSNQPPSIPSNDAINSNFPNEQGEEDQFFAVPLADKNDEIVRDKSIITKNSLRPPRKSFNNLNPLYSDKENKQINLSPVEPISSMSPKFKRSPLSTLSSTNKDNISPTESFKKNKNKESFEKPEKLSPSEGMLASNSITTGEQVEATTNQTTFITSTEDIIIIDENSSSEKLTKNNKVSQKSDVSDLKVSDHSDYSYYVDLSTKSPVAKHHLSEESTTIIPATNENYSSLKNNLSNSLSLISSISSALGASASTTASGQIVGNSSSAEECFSTERVDLEGGRSGKEMTSAATDIDGNKEGSNVTTSTNATVIDTVTCYEGGGGGGGVARNSLGETATIETSCDAAENTTILNFTDSNSTESTQSPIPAATINITINAVPALSQDFAAASGEAVTAPAPEAVSPFCDRHATPATPPPTPAVPRYSSSTTATTTTALRPGTTSPKPLLSLILCCSITLLSCLLFLPPASRQQQSLASYVTLDRSDNGTAVLTGARSENTYEPPPPVSSNTSPSDFHLSARRESARILDDFEAILGEKYHTVISGNDTANANATDQRDVEKTAASGADEVAPPTPPPSPDEPVVPCVSTASDTEEPNPRQPCTAYCRSGDGAVWSCQDYSDHIRSRERRPGASNSNSNSSGNSNSKEITINLVLSSQQPNCSKSLSHQSLAATSTSSKRLESQLWKKDIVLQHLIDWLTMIPRLPVLLVHAVRNTILDVIHRVTHKIGRGRNAVVSD